MYCNKCGAQLVEGAGFCAFCGSRRPAPIQRTVNADGQAPTMPGSPDQTNYQQPVQPPMQQPPMQQPVQQSTQQRSPEQLQAQRRLWLIIAAAVLGALLLIGGGVGIFCCVACGDEEPVEDQPGYVETIPSDEDAAADFTDQLALPENGEEIAVFETTAGTFRMRLFPGNAPETVENFTNLVRSGYYDGITFHRVIKGFMIQSGDPTGTGAGGDTFTGEPLKDEYGNGLYHFRYAVSMANTGMPDSGSSQFFIVQANTVFAGMDESGKVNELTVDQLITQLYTDLQPFSETRLLVAVTEVTHSIDHRIKRLQRYIFAFTCVSFKKGTDSAILLSGRGDKIYGNVFGKR